MTLQYLSEFTDSCILSKFYIATIRHLLKIILLLPFNQPYFGEVRSAKHLVCFTFPLWAVLYPEHPFQLPLTTRPKIFCQCLSCCVEDKLEAGEKKMETEQTLWHYHKIGPCHYKMLYREKMLNIYWMINLPSLPTTLGVLYLLPEV